jgi:hypothetical protein
MANRNGWRRQARSLAKFGVAMLVGWWIAALAGCAAAAAPGADVAGAAAGTVVDTTGRLLDKGKVESYQGISLEETIATVRKVAEELDLKLVREVKHPEQMKLIYTDERKHKIVLTVIRRTRRMSEIHADVGLFGEEGMAQLMIRQILKDLPEHEPVKAKETPEMRGGTTGH